MDIAAPIQGKPAHERTLVEFVGEKPAIDKLYGLWNEEAFILYRAPYFGDYAIKARNIFCTKPSLYGTSDPDIIKSLFNCFHVAVLDKDPAYAVLLADMIDADTGEVWIEGGPVGEFYRASFGINNLGIMAAYRGRGVGPYFVAGAIEATGNVEPSGAYSPAGLATRKKAHRILVENAIKRGDAVPMVVLEELGKA